MPDHKMIRCRLPYSFDQQGAVPFGHLWTIALSFSAAWFDSIPVSSFSNLQGSTQILRQDIFIAIKSKPSLKNFKFCSTFYPIAPCKLHPSSIIRCIRYQISLHISQQARCICIIFSTITRVCVYNLNLKLKCFGCLDLFNCLLVCVMQLHNCYVIPYFNLILILISLLSYGI